MTVKEHASKWSKIIHNFLESGEPIVRLYEPISTANAVICMKHYLDGKGFPVGYARRREFIYIFRTDSLMVTVSDAIAGNYQKEKSNAAS